MRRFICGPMINPPVFPLLDECGYIGPFPPTEELCYEESAYYAHLGTAELSLVRHKPANHRHVWSKKLQQCMFC